MKTNKTTTSDLSRGQAMVLACLTMLLIVFAMLSSFSLSNAIHAKIKLQSHVDATAYSVAVLEARAMNVVAYRNRVFFATVVTMMTMHGWNTVASSTVRILEAVKHSFENAPSCSGCAGDVSIAGICLTPCPHSLGVPAGVAIIAQAGAPITVAAILLAVTHAPHKPLQVFMATFVELQQGVTEGYLHDHEGPFNDTIKALHQSLVAVSDAQNTMLADVYSEIANPLAVLPNGVYSALASTNGIEQSRYANLSAMNQVEFACAFSGVPALPCPATARPGGAELNRSQKSAMARNSADAARSQFEADCENALENRGPPIRLYPPTGGDGTGSRRCAKALHDAFRPDHASWTRNFFFSLMVLVGFDFDGDSKMYFKLPLSVGGFAKDQNFVDDESPLERIVAVTERNRSDTIDPVETTPYYKFHGHTVFIKHGDTSDNTAIEGDDAFAPLPATGGLWSRVNPLGPWDEGVPSVMPTIASEYWNWKGNDVDVWKREASSMIWTAESGTRHYPGSSHSVGHDGVDTEFKGICNPLDAADVCFVSFRSEERPEYDFGQPSVYQGASRELSPLQKPWELNAQGKTKMSVLNNYDTRLLFKPRYHPAVSASGDMAFAVAKAKVYYHEFGNPYGDDQHDWRRPPNLFDPFWRAKLHPFRHTEKHAALSGAADSVGADLLDLVKVNVSNSDLAFGERE